MGLPGAILAPSALTEGDRVQARCRDGFWYNAKVIKKAGRGASVTATVNYVGFPATHDERFDSTIALRSTTTASCMRRILCLSTA